VVIDLQGRVYSETTGENGVVENFVDQLRVVTVAEPNKMTALSGQFFDPGSAEQSDAFSVQQNAENTRRAPIIQQGYAEASNVDSIQELVNMITIQRRYDAAQKALKQQTATGADFSDLLRGA
jgi:flagellar basal body rod protein FlgG